MKEGDHAHADLASILDNFNRECHELLADEDFRATITEACERRWRRWRSPRWYPLEDFVNDVIIKFGLGLDKLRDDEKWEHLLGKVVRNQIVDEYRRWNADRRPALHESLDPEKLDEMLLPSGTASEGIYDSILLEECLDCLSSEEREFISEFYLLGETQEQMAARRGVSPQAISRRVKRILGKIQRRFN